MDYLIAIGTPLAVAFLIWTTRKVSATSVMCKKGTDFYKIITDTYFDDPEFQSSGILHSNILIKFFPEKFSNIGSRVKLASPVTKTNQQTMKITYTINIA